MKTTRINRQYFYRVMYFDPMQAKIKYTHNVDLTKARLDYLESTRLINNSILNSKSETLTNYLLECKKDIEQHGVRLCVEEVLSKATING